MEKPVVAVAMSGGIDSLVTAWLVRQKFKHVFGIHFITGYEKQEPNLKFLESQINFNIKQINLSHEFEQEVVKYFVSSYLEGQTPNPCITCNKVIKFGKLMEKSIILGADILATGHYARIVNSITCPQKNISLPWLEKGRDPAKDQSYFLARLTLNQMNRIIFPLADLTKETVNHMARKNGLIPLTPSESQDICFIDKQKYSQFILTKTGMIPKPGHIKDIHGKIIGTHKGLHKFTVGQRRGINLPSSEPYYVRQIDPKNNTLYVCFKKDLKSKEMDIVDLTWHNETWPEIGTEVLTKIRYSHPPALSRLIICKTPNKSETSIKILFDQPQYAVTPGQIAVFYQGARVLGSGIIK